MEHIKIEVSSKDVIFKDSKGKELNYHANKELIEYLVKNNGNKQFINKSLLANKYCKVLKRSNNNLLFQEIEKSILGEIEKNNKLIKSSLEGSYKFIEFEGKLNDKLVMGLGNVSTFETDITLHHTYGIPYIPGSAIKGVLRNYIIGEYSEKFDKSNCYEKPEKKAENNDVFRSIFGGQDKDGKSIQGNVIFMDAFPKDKYEIALDVMTPHHKKYYEGVAEPKDSEPPVPINFLVLKNCSFIFYIAVKKSIIENSDFKIKLEKLFKNNDLEKFIRDNLKQALNVHGIGAKTSVGYGYFDI